MFLGGFRLKKLCGIMLPRRQKPKIIAAHAWNYGVYIDIRTSDGIDASSTRLVCLHQPDSWKPLDLFQGALQDLQGILQTSPSAQLVLAGDWNVEMACCTDHRLVGSASTESPYPESRLRARLTYEVLDRFNLVMGSTFTDGVSFERAFVGTYCHWSAGRAKTLDYVAASGAFFNFCQGQRYAG
eukprot:2865933-Amphidinium_carterae.1